MSFDGLTLICLPVPLIRGGNDLVNEWGIVMMLLQKCIK